MTNENKFLDDIIILAKKYKLEFEQIKKKGWIKPLVIGKKKEGGEVMSKYVTHEQLKKMDFVTHTQLKEILDIKFKEQEDRLYNRLEKTFNDKFKEQEDRLYNRLEKTFNDKFKEQEDSLFERLSKLMKKA